MDTRIAKVPKSKTSQRIDSRIVSLFHFFCCHRLQFSLVFHISVYNLYFVD
jgi:hypothetical protein